MGSNVHCDGQNCIKKFYHLIHNKILLTKNTYVFLCSYLVVKLRRHMDRQKYRATYA